MKLPTALWVILVLTIILLVADGIARADDKNTHYCIQIDNGNKTVMQCQNGTVTIVDSVSDKVENQRLLLLHKVISIKLLILIPL